MLNTLITLVTFSLLGSSIAWAANENIATITRKFGGVVVLSNPKEKISGPPPHALFEGKYYSERQAKRGAKVGNGEIVQTGKSGRTRLIFPNGDQITLSPMSAYRIEWDANKPLKKPKMDALMGKLRGVIDSEGPRSGTEVRTRSMVMGVRGTDFFVSSRGKSGNSEVTVMRGKVAVAPREEPRKKGDVSKAKKAPKPVEIPAGYSVKVGPAKSPKKGAVKSDEKEDQAEEAPVIEIKKATTQQLAVIEKVSVVPNSVPVMIAGDSKEAREARKEEEKLKSLEEKAVKVTVKDIKKYDEELYKQISSDGGKISDTDQINQKVTNKLIEKAPAPDDVEGQKPDLNDIGKDTYDRYYNQ